MIEKSPISTVSEKILTSWFDGKIFWLPLFCYHGDIYKLIFAVTSCWYVLPKFLHSKPISKWISNLAILNVKCYIRCLFTIETALKRANLSYLTIWNPEMSKVCYHLSDLTKNHLCWCYDFTEIFTMQFSVYISIKRVLYQIDGRSFSKSFHVQDKYLSRMSNFPYSKLISRKISVTENSEGLTWQFFSLFQLLWILIMVNFLQL